MAAKHNNRQLPSGVPLLDGKTKDRFFSSISATSQELCHEWMLGRSNRGYGNFSINNHTYSAHRLAFKIANPEFDGVLFVLHKCDNRGCVNPAHLFLGDHGDNMRDMVAKGRCPNSRHRSHKAKLSPSDVLDIIRRYRAGGVTQTQLAMEYGVNQSSISMAILGRPKLRVAA